MKPTAALLSVMPENEIVLATLSAPSLSMLAMALDPSSTMVRKSPVCDAIPVSERETSVVASFVLEM